MINKISENELMESFYNLIPYFEHFFGTDLVFTISNTERFLLVKDNDKLRMVAKTGDIIPKGCAADVCLKEKSKVYVMVPDNVFGVPLKTMAVPVMVDNKIEGTIVIGMSVENKEKMSNMAKTLSESLSQMSLNAVDMASRFQEISETNLGIGDFISKTNEYSKKTDEVLSFVEDIAKQTNLLGLNAAIESARAGEYGKGFSVVSNEIRKLSKSTKESIEQINTTLRNIQNSIGEIERRFENSNNLLENQTAGLEEITATIQELTSNAALLNEFASTI
ncbi:MULTISPECIES: methyl-accepting chemotaxis protein [Clostridium]|uniref:Methyl-accepting chemotaxis protein n=1 Tax=Clostridium butyricum TaxID=1492 RepID=A0AAP9RE15_CLOBU|nr:MULTISPECIES: methyl-accepting chemotaxis protein [Clostridium]ALP90134.1 chemotaxis protein [Clostridium butyricum]ALS16588.1 chemotaxis protein [Clostridium butyricum]ANF13752.1 chemotaxis protein [Clostridium butyricum]AOR93819.1 chemotaxis protein [Clostridium butyricum]AXB84446.1 methyl-accepting chemotaxis protein [Clostridium butyricum]